MLIVTAGVTALQAPRRTSGLSKIRTGISWRDLPERYGPWKTVYTRFRRIVEVLIAATAGYVM